MKFRMKEFVDKAKELRVRKYIVLIVILTMVPALYLTVGIIKETVYKGAASRFISEELNFPNTQIIDRTITYHNSDSDKEIKVILVGSKVPDESIDLARAKMAKYNLEGVKLNVIQGMNDVAPDVKSIKALVLEDFYKESQAKISMQQQSIDSLITSLDTYKVFDDLTGLSKEISVLYPSVKSISIAKSNEIKIGTDKGDPIVWAIIGYSGTISDKEKDQIQKWLQARLATTNLVLIVNK